MVVLAMERGIVGDGGERQRGREKRISVVGAGEEMAGSQREKESCTWRGGVDGME